MNLLEETKEVLEENGKTIKDILWIGTNEFKTSIESFIKNSDIEYDNGFGTQEVEKDLIIVGKDWWIERHGYDGSEWWEFKSIPIKPKKTIEVNKFIGGMWEYLKDLNKTGG